jgi:hypothetical protein
MPEHGAAYPYQRKHAAERLRLVAGHEIHALVAENGLHDPTPAIQMEVGPAALGTNEPVPLVRRAVE